MPELKPIVVDMVGVNTKGIFHAALHVNCHTNSEILWALKAP
jgi:hypothetical protein